MIFHVNYLLADYSHEVSFLFFSKIKLLQKLLHNLSSAAVVIGALRVKTNNRQLDDLSLGFV